MERNKAIRHGLRAFLSEISEAARYFIAKTLQSNLYEANTIKYCSKIIACVLLETVRASEALCDKAIVL